jgi:type II secretory ATPase GspE/PulE/Tfp pilus assembly ATPase PilB-like protein
MIWEHIEPILKRNNITTTSLSNNLLVDDNTVLPHLIDNLGEQEVVNILQELEIKICPQKEQIESNKIDIEYVNDDFVVLNDLKTKELIAYATNPFLNIQKFNIQSKYPGIKIDAIGYISSANSIFTKNKSNTKQIVDNDDLLYTIIERAINLTASDIHISVRNKKNIAIKFRVFGEIIESSIDDIDINNYISFANNILKKSKGNNSAFNSYFEGNFIYKQKAINITIRLQLNPSVYFFDDGAKKIPNFVLRIHDLNKKVLFKNINEIGFTQEQANALKAISQHNSGLVVVSGPTGSGKTTALYSILGEAIKRPRIVQTIEDPVEIIFPGINQTNIDEAAGITYESAINKSIVRSDTDVALIGEIRSAQTAQGVVDLKRKGHLVLTTIHTDNTLAIIPTLQDFGVPLSYIADNLSVMISTRLVKKVCSHCSELVSVSELHKFSNQDIDELSTENALIAKANKVKLKQLKIQQGSKYTNEQGISLVDRIALVNKNGCSKCSHGYYGRELVAETIIVDNTMREMIRKNSGMEEIIHHIQNHGNLTIWQHGLSLVKAGKTTIEALEHVLPTYSSYGNNYSSNESNRI